MPDSLDRLAAALAGRYTLEGEIGAGGMATVYRARDVKHDRHVAVKIMRPELTAVLGPDRFLAEIRISARLEHPHILTLIDSGEADGLLYFVMPLVHGESLADRLDRDGRLELSEALRLTGQVAGALEYAHREGVVHRDIKPENILLHEGEAMVTDFGIALAVSEAGGGRLTQTGLSLGTPGYMSPEQASGERTLDARTDVYALGTVLYEMLAGKPPFDGDTAQEVLARVITEKAPAIRSVRNDVPVPIERALSRALEKDPSHRFANAGEFAQALAAVTDRGPTAMAPGRKRLIVALVVMVAVMVGVVGLRSYRDGANRRWAREVALPEIERLILDSRSYVEAFHLAKEAEQHLPDDARLSMLMRELTTTLTATSDPPGATVSYQEYTTEDTTWYHVGITPIEDAEVPAWYVRMRFELPGYRPLEIFHAPMLPVNAVLIPDSEPYEFVRIAAGAYAYSSRTPAPVDEFLLGTLEITNRAYQRFVDSGGYSKPEYWVEAQNAAEHTGEWRDLVGGFVDRTGRAGPATWELSRYAEGTEEHPVGGVSWFESVAYCAFVGQSVPTYHQWKHAAGLEIVDDMLKHSNFDGAGPRPVGTGGAVGGFGVHDMAGNVREWVWNAAGERRYILGGSWEEPQYQFMGPDAQSPYDRSETNGLRCARNLTPLPDEARARLDLPYFDFAGVDPVGDDEYELLTRFYDYDPVALEALVEAEDTSEFWIRQRVSYTAAYAEERVVAFVFLPRNVDPPYQSVVFFPGSGAFLRRSSVTLAHETALTFVPRSGRALVYPIYKGSHERFIENRRPGSAAARQRMVWMTQDLRRTVDYVVQREDMVADPIGYLGISLGGEIVMPYALESRFDALVLVGAAFDAQWLDGALPETAPWNFASRVTAPALIINGRNDFQHPFETGQIPFFNALGTPDADKDTVITEAGHLPAWNDIIRHSLRWFDRYLGPVDQPH